MLSFLSGGSKISVLVVVGALVPMAIAAPACGGSDIGADAFGEGGAAGTPAATTGAVGPATQASSAASGGGEAPGTGGSTSDGGGGSTSDGGGGEGGAGGGEAGAGGEGGAGGGEPTCEDGCAPLGDAGADCDEDGDPNGADCQPCNADVRHDQDGWFDAPYTLLGSDETSFDYDCSSTVESEYAYVPGGCDAFNGNTCPEGESIYTGDQAPECGVSQTVEDCDTQGLVIAMCVADGPASTMAVRCR